MGLADYRDFEHLLGQSRALTDVAEAHGTLAGALCASEEYRFEDWLRALYAESHGQRSYVARRARSTQSSAGRARNAGRRATDQGR